MLPSVRLLLALALAVTVLPHQPAAAQAPAPAPASPPAARLFAPHADVAAMIARAKRERKADQANFVQPIVQHAPYTVNLEYRVAGLNANASLHERDAELFLVIEGAGTIVTDGTLTEERRSNADNRQGSGISGGTRRHLGQGDWIMVPEGTPHWFTEIEGTLVLMSVHLPRRQ